MLKNIRILSQLHGQMSNLWPWRGMMDQCPRREMDMVVVKKQNSSPKLKEEINISTHNRSIRKNRTMMDFIQMHGAGDFIWMHTQTQKLGKTPREARTFRGSPWTSLRMEKSSRGLKTV